MQIILIKNQKYKILQTRKENVEDRKVLILNGKKIKIKNKTSFNLILKYLKTNKNKTTITLIKIIRAYPQPLSKNRLINLKSSQPMQIA